MIKSKIELKCDLCKHPSKSYDSIQEAENLGWLTIGQEEYYTERSFFDSHICPNCRKSIEAKLKS